MIFIKRKKERTKEEEGKKKNLSPIRLNPLRSPHSNLLNLFACPFLPTSVLGLPHLTMTCQFVPILRCMSKAFYWTPNLSDNRYFFSRRSLPIRSE